MSHAVMPLADYVGACDAIREKTGGTEPITSGELVEQIGAVHTAGKLAALESAEVLKGNLFGNPVTATAVTPITHNTGARLESKNLFDADSWAATELPRTSNGITYEYEGDGVFHIYGTATANGGGTNRSYSLALPCELNDKYTMSIEYLSGTTEVGIYMFFGLGEANSTSKIMNWVRCHVNSTTSVGTIKTNTATPSEDLATAKYINAFWFYNSDTAGNGTVDIRVRVWLEHSSTSTPYTPYVSDFTKVRTRNIFPFPKDYITTSSPGGAKVLEVLPNGAVFQGGYEESSHSIPSWDNGWGVFGGEGEWLYLRAEETVTISADYTVLEAHESRTGHESIGIWFYGNNMQYASVTHSIPSEIGKPTRVRATYTVHVDGYYWPIFTLNSNKVKIENLQIEYGTEATPYVPYTIPAVVTKRGKNLIPYPYTDTTKTVNGVTFTDNGDGTLTVSGTPTAGASFLLGDVDLPPGKYMLYHGVDTKQFYGSGLAYIRLACKKGGTLVYERNMYCNWEDNGQRYLDTSAIDYDTATVYLHANNVGSYIPFILHRPQLEVGSVATEFEKGSPVITYPADAEGNLGEVPSISPTMILECPDVEGVNIVAHYLKDIDGAFEERLAELEAAIVEIA